VGRVSDATLARVLLAGQRQVAGDILARQGGPERAQEGGQHGTVEELGLAPGTKTADLHRRTVGSADEELDAQQSPVASGDDERLHRSEWQDLVGTVVAVSGVVVRRCPAQVLGGTQLTEEAEPDAVLLPDVKIGHAPADGSQAGLDSHKGINE
jgi:hypothetical protein